MNTAEAITATRDHVANDAPIDDATLTTIA